MYKFTYLSCAGTELSAPAVAPMGPAVGEADVAAATSGNCCLKLASKSSPGFCELVLRRNHVSHWRTKHKPNARVSALGAVEVPRISRHSSWPPAGGAVRAGVVSSGWHTSVGTWREISRPRTTRSKGCFRANSRERLEAVPSSRSAVDRGRSAVPGSAKCRGQLVGGSRGKEGFLGGVVAS